MGWRLHPGNDDRIRFLKILGQVFPGVNVVVAGRGNKKPGLSAVGGDVGPVAVGKHILGLFPRRLGKQRIKLQFKKTVLQAVNVGCFDNILHKNIAGKAQNSRGRRLEKVQRKIKNQKNCDVESQRLFVNRRRSTVFRQEWVHATLKYIKK